MKKVIIIGCSGAGKSTLAIKMSKKVGLPLIHLDKENWKPGWEDTPREIWQAKVKQLVEKPEWIMDGNYRGTIEPRIKKADTVLFLYFNRFICIWGVLKRLITGTRVDPIPGCKEQFDYEFIKFLKWIWTYNKKVAPYILKLLSVENESEKNIFIFKNRKQVNQFLENL